MTSALFSLTSAVDGGNADEKPNNCTKPCENFEHCVKKHTVFYNPYYKCEGTCASLLAADSSKSCTGDARMLKSNLKSIVFESADVFDTRCCENKPTTTTTAPGTSVIDFLPLPWRKFPCQQPRTLAFFLQWVHGLRIPMGRNMWIPDSHIIGVLQEGKTEYTFQLLKRIFSLIRLTQFA